MKQALRLSMMAFLDDMRSEFCARDRNDRFWYDSEALTRIPEVGLLPSADRLALGQR
jgi:hypothetical protein